MTRVLCNPSALLAAAMIVALAGCSLPNNIRRQQGYDAYRKGDVATAERKFGRNVEAESTDWKSHYFLGRIALERGDAAEAQRRFELAHVIRQRPSHYGITEPARDRREPDAPWPSRVEMVDAIAEAIYRQGNEPELFSFLDRQIDRYAEPRDYVRKAEYLAKVGDHDGAVVAYRAAIRIDPENPRLYLALSEFFAGIGDRESAQRQLRHAYYLDRDNPRLADRLRSYGVVPGPTAALAPEFPPELPSELPPDLSSESPSELPPDVAETVDFTAPGPASDEASGRDGRSFKPGPAVE